MSPELDIDDLVRSTMRRHAADAPTTIDLDGVRARSVAITRRRRYETLAAVVTTLVVLLGLGYAASQLRTQATPVEPVPSDGLPWVAFPTFDPNGQPNGSTSIVVRSGGAERSIPAPANGATTLGWYGPGARTLVYTAGGDAVRESRLLSATVSEDGRTISAPTELEIPGLGTVTGRAYTVRGAGPVVWQPTKPNGSQGRLVLVGADLTTADIVDLPPGQPLFVTSSVIGLGSSETTRIQLVSTSTGEMTGSFDTCTRPNYQVAVSYDDSHVALSCGDGTVQLVNLGGPANPRLAAVPDAAGRGGFVGLWFDPAGGLHAATTPEMQPDYAVVNDYDYNGVSWDAAGNDVLTRVFPTPSSHVDLEYHAQKWAYTPHWVVKQPHELDLGETTGTAIVFRPQQDEPTPTPTSNALPTAPSPPPWTTTTRDAGVTNPVETALVATTSAGEVVVDKANAAPFVAGWTGPGRRTLVYGWSQEGYDVRVMTATFDDGGHLVGAPAVLKHDGRDVFGRAFLTPDGALAVAVAPRGGGRHVQVLRYDADLTSATAQALPANVFVEAVSAQYIVLRTIGTGANITVLGPEGSGTIENRGCVTSDAGGNAFDNVSVVLDPTGTRAMAFCGYQSLGPWLFPLGDVARGSTGTSVQLPDAPGSPYVLNAWFDRAGDVAVVTSTSQSDTADLTTWTHSSTAASGDWAKQGTTVLDEVLVDGYAVQLLPAPGSGSGSPQPTLVTATDPQLTLGTTFGVGWSVRSTPG